MIFSKKIKKYVSLLFVLLFLVPSFLLIKPQKAEAISILGFSLDEADWGLFIKETVLDGIAYAIVNITVSEISRQTVDWIRNSNFINPDGKSYSPAFVTQPGNFLRDTGDAILGETIESFMPGICEPFRFDIRAALTARHSNTFEEDYCTFSDVKKNTTKAFNEFTEDFNNGGWEQWIRMTTNPYNNPTGAYVMADLHISSRVGEEKLLEQKKLDWGNGMLSQTKKSCEEYAVPYLPVFENGDIDWSEAGWRDENTGKIVKIIDETTSMDDAPCVLGEKEEIVTPGSFLQEQLSSATGMSQDRLVIADEIDEVIGALLTQLTQLGLNELGLLGDKLDGDEYASSLAKIRAKFNDFKQGMIESVEKYLDIKKRSLTLTGAFEMDEESYSQSHEEKIDWNGNNYNWSKGKYYTISDPVPVDWNGINFEWATNKYYDTSKNISSCILLSDSGNVGYRIVNNNIWSKSECVEVEKNLEDGTTKIEVEWSQPTNLNPVASGTKSGVSEVTSCEGGNSNVYTVPNETDLNWSKTTCRGSSTNITWGSILPLTNKPTYKTVTTNNYEQYIDWDGYTWRNNEPWEYEKIYFEDRLSFVDMNLRNNDPFRPEIYENEACFVNKEFPCSSSKLGGFINAVSEAIGFNYLTGITEDEYFPNYITRHAISGPNLKLTAYDKPKSFFGYIPPLQNISQIENGGMCWGAEELKVYGVKANSDKWIELTCKKMFQNNYGWWTKTGTYDAHSVVKIDEEGFRDILSQNGDIDVKNDFNELKQCLLNGGQSTAVIDNKISNRKNLRFKIAKDIAFKEGFLSNLTDIDNSLDSYITYNTANEFDYSSFLNTINSIRSGSGVSDAELTEAEAELEAIINENERISSGLQMCTAGNYDDIDLNDPVDTADDGGVDADDPTSGDDDRGDDERDNPYD